VWLSVVVTDPPVAENFPLMSAPVSHRAKLSDTPPSSSDTLFDTLPDTLPNASSQPVHRLEFGVYVFEDAGEITDEEKNVISEFFIGRDRKTPERYLQYRTFIISKW